MDTHLVVGLGNPGGKYSRNRQNVGFMFLDYLMDRLEGGSFSFQKALNGSRAKLRLSSEPIILLKPDTYMNRSGFSVSAAASYFKILSENIVICYDDVDIPFGNFRIRLKGSSGGHRGIASIIEQLGSRFVRIRIGIAPDDGKRGNLAGFVLSDFRDHELDVLKEVFDEIYRALEMIVAGRVSRAMNEFNRRSSKGHSDEE